jgi:hypothetical protein
MNVFLRILALAALSGAVFVSAPAQEAPMLIQCQGRLSDGAQPLNGEMQMILRLYDQPQGGTLRYEDTGPVRLVDGLYTTFLGDHTTQGSLKDALSSGPLWLEVIANGTVFSPRERLTSVPFAALAESVRPGSVDGASIRSQSIGAGHLGRGSVGLEALMENAVDSSRILDGSIAERDLADGAVTPPKLSMSYWTTRGNLNEGGEMIFLGTLDARPVDLRVNNRRALRLEPHAVSPILVAGHEVNDAGQGAAGGVVGGGGQPNQPNKVEGEFAVVDGGADNRAKGAFSVVGGGLGNLSGGARATVAGGRANLAEGAASVIGGGFSNRVTNSFATIAGGHANLGSGYVAAIGGGWGNAATGAVAVVSGGQENRAGGDAAAVAGGWMNLASGYASSVGGGRANRAEGGFAAVLGGTNNVAAGRFATVAGGRENQALGEASLAAGARARAAHDGSFVWADGGAGVFSSTAGNQFLIRAAGNVGIDTNQPDQKLTVNGAVRAKAFLGDGSALTGITAANLAEGAVADAHLRADAAIAPAKIAGEALTRKTSFGGVLEGTADNLALKPGSVGRDHLAPGLLALALADSDLAREVKTLAESALRRDAVFGGAVTGRLDRLVLRPGVVGAAELAPGLLERAVAESPLAAQVAALGSAKLDAAQVFSGDIIGTATNLQLRAGSVGPDELMPGLLASAIASSELAAGLVRFQEQARKEFARQSDLEKMRQDLGGVFTKAEWEPVKATLGTFATRQDLEGLLKGQSVLPNLATKAELEPLRQALAAAAAQADLESVRQSQTGLASRAALEGLGRTLAESEAALRKDLETIRQAQTTLAARADTEALARKLGEVEASLTRDLAGLREAQGQLATRAEAQAIAKELADTDAARRKDLETLRQRLQAMGTPAELSVAGVVTGKLGAVALRDGAVESRHLAPGIWDDLKSTQGLLTEAVATLSKQSLSLGTPLGGEVAGTPAAVQIRNGVITAEKLADGAVTLAKLAPDAQAALQPKLADGSITLAKLAPDAQAALQPKLADGSITLAKLAPDAQAALQPKLADGSITLAKLAPDAQAALRPKIGEGSVGLAQLAPDVRRALEAPPATLPNGSVGAAQLAAGAVTVEKLDPAVLTRLSLPTQADGAIRLGTTRKAPLTLTVAGAPAWSARPGEESPVLIAGSPANQAANALSGVVIAGGGSEGDPQRAAGNYVTLGGGLGNRAELDYATVAGGYLNTARGSAATVAGGWKNTAGELNASVAGGQGNTASGVASAIGGGFTNQAPGKYATVPGGSDNVASGDFSLAAGRRARAQHEGAVVFADSTDADFASTARNQFLIRASGNVGIDVANPSEKLTVGGNVAPGLGSAYSLGSADKRWRSLYLDSQLSFREALTLTSGDVVRFQIDASGGVAFAGMRTVAVEESPSVLGGHLANRLAPGVAGATVAGGGNAKHPNEVAADYGSVGGGFGNRVTGFDGTIGGGQDNLAGGTAATIGGGFLNQAAGLFPTIAGGAANQATANLAVIAGGFSNKVTGAYAVVPGGYQNEANGDYAFAAGRRGRAAHSGSFVWADSTNAAFSSTERNQFLARATGGVWFYTSPELASGVKLNAGSGSWSMLSDRAVKDNLKPLDGRETLEKLAQLPVYEWNYKAQADTVRHVGPTAQDFSAAFGVGEDDRHITAVDADGVALSAIQGLYQVMREKDAVIQRLEDQNRRLLDRLESIEKRLDGTP